MSVHLRCSMTHSCHAKSRLFRRDESRSSPLFLATASLRRESRMTSAAITTSPGTRNAFFRQNFLVGRTRGVIIGTLHEIDMRPRGHPRCDERAFGVEVNPATRVR